VTTPLQAVVVCGGMGTRLRGLHPGVPKALVRVAGRPFIEWQIEWLARGGIRHVHLAAGYLAKAVQALAENEFTGTESGVSLTCSAEPAPLGTGGGLRFVEPFIRSDPFLVINGDSLLPNLDWSRLRESFQPLERSVPEVSNPWTVLAVTRIGESGRYGTVEFDERGRITAFREKAEREGGWVNGGVYRMNRAVLDLIPPDRGASLESDVFPRMARAGQLRAFEAPPPLLDMGTPEGLSVLERFLSGD